MRLEGHSLPEQSWSRHGQEWEKGNRNFKGRRRGVKGGSQEVLGMEKVKPGGETSGNPAAHAFRHGLPGLPAQSPALGRAPAPCLGEVSLAPSDIGVTPLGAPTSSRMHSGPIICLPASGRAPRSIHPHVIFPEGGHQGPGRASQCFSAGLTHSASP